MKIDRKIAASVILLTSLAPASTMAQDSNGRSIDQYTCKDVMREHGDNRDVSIAFLHGYLLGKSGKSDFNLDSLHKQTNAFIEYCLDNPHDKAIDAMAKIKG